MEKMLKNVWFWISMTLVVVNILFYMNIKGYILLPSQKEKRVENSQKQPMESITLPEILKVSTKDVFYSYDIYQTDYSGGNEANLALEFSEKVYSDDLNQHLAIFPFSTPLKNKIGENPEKVFKNPDDFQTNKLDYSIEKDKNSRLISINVKRGISKKLLIVLSKSLKDETDKLKLFRTRIYTLMLDKELKVNYLDSYVNWSNEHSIKLRFNHSVKKTALKSYLKIEPAVNWWIKDNYYNYLISGNFEAGKRYRITFFKGLPGKNNTFIGKDFSRSLRMRDYRPAVRFTGKGNYLSDKGKMKLSFETVNLSKITFVAHQVYSNNVIHYLQSSYYSSKEKFSKELAKKEIRIEDDFNEKVIHHLDLKSFLKDQETGIFIVKAHGYGMDSKDYYSEKLVMLTDMGISVKKSDTDFCVWVTSLNDLHSVENAEVKLITNKNQCLLTGKTNKDGVVHFKDVAFENDGKPYAVIVSKNEKFTVLELSKGKMELSELELLGRENDPGAYDAFIFTERGVYRPGETVHSKALVRMYEKTHLELPESFPVVLNVIRPDGNIFVEKTILLSDAGDCSWDIDIPHTARTGKYQLKMQLPESKETIGITTFLVEDFIPDKIKLSIKADEKRFQLKDTIDFKVKARHLFGAPGANRKVYAYYRIFSSIFAPKNYSSYSFITPEKKDNAVKIKLGKKTLDSEGEAIFSVKPAAKGKLSSPIEIQFVASVKEMGGRSVTRVCSRKMDTQPFYLGLKRMREGTVQRGVKERFKFVILNAEGEIFAPEKKRLKADLLFVHWNWVLSESRSGYHYECSKEYQLIKSGTLAKGVESFAFSMDNGGEYMVVLTDELTKIRTAVELTCVSDGYSSWSKEKPDRAELFLYKDNYNYGDTAKLMIKSPFEGKGLLTIEGDSIFDYIPFEMNSEIAELDIPIKEEYGLNFYLSATILRKNGEGAPAAARRAFGVTHVKINHAARRLNISATFPNELKPETDIPIDITIKDFQGSPVSTEFTIALVDEGICTLTNFKTPDPFNHFYAKRALEVTTYDLFSMLMPEDRDLLKKSTPGGSGAYKSGLLNPVQTDRIKNAIVWKTNLKTDKNGNWNKKVTFPDYVGELRFMVIAANGEQFGFKEEFLKVKRPLLIRSSCPRFLAPEDKFTLAVTVFNYTKGTGDVNLKVSAKIKEGIFFNTSQTHHILKDSEKTTYFSLKAPKTPGKMDITIVVEKGKEKTVEVIEIPVRAGVQLTGKTGAGIISGKTAKDSLEQTIELPGNWMPGTAESWICLSGMPELKLGDTLRNLLKYPYGCIEQTTSMVFPLLYFSDLAMAIDPELASEKMVNNYVQDGIMRIVSMQTSKGGFSYWPGGYVAYPWGSVYAANCLFEAKKAGFTVAKDALKDVSRYMESLLADKKISLSVKSYILYVQALSGKPNRAWALRLREEKEDLAYYSRAHLALAFMALKETKLAKELMKISVPKKYVTRERTGSLNSYLRENAILLSAYLDMNTSNKNIPILVQTLNDALNKKTYLSTQENAFILLAMGKYVKNNLSSHTSFTAELYDNTEKCLGKMTQREQIRITKKLAGKKLKIKMQGKGNLYYYWNVKGVPMVPEETNIHNNLKVSRCFLTVEKKETNQDSFKQGELFMVELIAEADFDMENIVISDLLPAGLEIENSRLATREKKKKNDKKKKDYIKPDFVESRDDRLLVFTSLKSGKSKYYYTVRAITKGTYTLPPVYAECMYDPKIKSVGDFKNISVK